MFTSIRNFINNRYKLMSNDDGVVQENGDSTGENLDSALNQRYKKGRNINAEVSNALKYRNFKWPKKDQDWQTLISLIDNKLDSFQEDVDVNKTIIDLRDKIRIQDIAAGYIIVKEAGGLLLDSEFNPLDADLSYDTRVSFI